MVEGIVVQCGLLPRAKAISDPYEFSPARVGGRALQGP